MANSRREKGMRRGTWKKVGEKEVAEGMQKRGRKGERRRNLIGFLILILK